MLRRRKLMGMQNKPKIVNLFPFATGTEIASTWEYSSASYRYVLTGLDPTQDYTLQVTITVPWETTAGRRFYMYADTAAGSFIHCSSDNAPITKTLTRKPNANGELTFSHNGLALNSAEYAASLTNIMLEIGSVAHPYVPYKG